MEAENQLAAPLETFLVVFTKILLFTLWSPICSILFKTVSCDYKMSLFLLHFSTVTTVNVGVTLYLLSIWLLTATGNNISSFLHRPSVGARPPHLQCERDLGEPGVEPAPEHRGTPGPDIQRGVQALRARRPALPALRQQHPLQPPAAEPEGNPGVHQRAAGPHQLHLRGVGGERSLAPEPRAGTGCVRDRHHQPGR